LEQLRATSYEPRARFRRRLVHRATFQNRSCKLVKEREDDASQLNRLGVSQLYQP
jgi:hypothetical protein